MIKEITNAILTARLQEEIEDRKSMSISGDITPLIIVGTDCRRSNLKVCVADSYKELFDKMLDDGDLDFDYLNDLYGYTDENEEYSLRIEDYKNAIYDGLEHRNDRFYYSEDNFNEWDYQERNSIYFDRLNDLKEAQETINKYKYETNYFNSFVSQEELFQSLRDSGYGKAESLVLIASLINSGAKFKENY